MENVTLEEALLAIQSQNTLNCLVPFNGTLFGSCLLNLFDIISFPAGPNSGYQLIQQWIVYHLNVAEGRAPCPSCVTPEIANIDAIVTQLIMKGCTGANSAYNRNTIDTLLPILSAYNNGEYGPGMCQTDDQVYCTPQPDCGCTYTRGYWQSPRFRTYPYSSKKKSTDSVKDTCNWPVNETNHLENDLLNCKLGSASLTKWDVVHGTYKGKDLGAYSINKQWISAMAQAVAFELNLLNGACVVGCQHSEYISGQCALAQQFFVEDVSPFIDPLGQTCKVSTSTAIGTCGDACQSLCEELHVLTTCDMATVLASFNNGTNGIGPGHCEATPDGNATRRGCCENCNCYAPACTPEIILFQSEITEVSGGDLTLEEELDIAMLFFIILGSLSIVFIAVMLFICVRNPTSTLNTYMGKKYDMVTAQPMQQTKWRFQ